MGGPGSGRKRGPAKAQPRGARWRETRQKVFAAHGDTCAICHHPGAGDVHHLAPTADVAGYYDLSQLVPAHGIHSRCGVCGRACNQSVGGAARMAAHANGNGKRISAPLPKPPGHQCDAERCPYRPAHASRCW